MSVRDIRTSAAQIDCDVCGRTLLRGERADSYLAGGTRRSVCELCGTRAHQEGWVREGSVPSAPGRGSDRDQRRSLLERFRARRETANGAPPVLGPSEELAARDLPDPQRREGAREPRHVRAVPSRAEQKVSSAVAVFNASEHRRTVAGVARSLGAPSVAVLPSQERGSLVEVVVSWELCWYRYEVDLSDEHPCLRVLGQGYELEELRPHEREPNALADESGRLVLA